MMKRDVNNIPVFIKELLIQTPIQHVVITPFLRILNRLRVEGSEILRQLPRTNVLFVSNHQTFYMEGIALMGEFNRSRHPFLHWFWKAATGHCYYIVALETAKREGLLHRLLEWAGAVTVTRTWRRGTDALEKGYVPLEQVRKDQEKIVRAIKEGWVITFPQGTTDPGARGRKGTAYIIKEAKCIVVPVVVDGFSKAFYKSAICRPIRLFTGLNIRFKPPLDINYDDPPGLILSRIMDAIEQSDKFMKPADSCAPR